MGPSKNTFYIMNNYQKIIFGILLILIFSCGRVNKDTPEFSLEEFNHNGLTREYIFYAPNNLKKDAPLVVVLHGFTSSAEKIMNYSKINTLAEENNFAVVYPQGSFDKNSNTFWNVGYTFHSDVTIDDVDFIVALVKYLQNRYSLSVTNTFLTGMSNGGEMCYLLACNHPEVFSAIAPVAGMMLQSFFDNCDSMNPIPVFAVFGTDDEVTNFNGDLHDEDGWGSYISIPSTIEYWAKRVDYDAVEIDTLRNINVNDSSFIVSECYLNSQTEKEVLFYKVIHGGHEWPGAWGNMDVSISNEIWNFFETHIK
jgi:polyhydroxybutyrate depolymerase